MELQKKLRLNLFKETSIKNKSDAQNLFIEAVKALYVEDIQSVKSVATSKIFTEYFEDKQEEQKILLKGETEEKTKDKNKCCC